MEAARKRQLHGVSKRRHSFAEAVKGYVDDGHYLPALEKALDHFGEWAVADITPADVREYARKGWPGCKGATMNQHGIVPVRAVVNWAHEQGWCGALRVRAFETEKVERRAVDEEWVAAMEVASLEFEGRGRSIGAMVRLMSSTGMRINECVRLRWKDVDVVGMSLKLGRTKNGEHYTVALGEDVLEAMLELKGGAGAEEPVFGFTRRPQVYYHWRQVEAVAGVEHVPPHQAGRHTFATVLHNEHGWSANDIAKAGRWKSPALVQQVYIHSDKESREAAALLGRKRAGEGGGDGKSL